MKKFLMAALFVSFFQPALPVFAGNVIVEGTRVSEGKDGVVRVTAGGLAPRVSVSAPKAGTARPAEYQNSSATNHGVLFSSGAPERQKYASANNVQGSIAGPIEFTDRHAWRSGIAGTFAMWRQFVVNALPSNEGFPEVKKKKPPVRPAKK